MKAMTMYRPMNFENAIGDLDRYFGSLFGDSPLSQANRILDAANKVSGRLPAMDIRETENGFLLEAELPGYEEADIQIHLDGRLLTIESKKEGETSEGTKADGNYLIRERRSRSFSRSFQLPENADSEAISASFKNGLLCLNISKKVEVQKKVIEINKN
ncbi:Hsp20/alpha crystallin family protein [Breznakiellaceae bacterium SP9]